MIEIDMDALEKVLFKDLGDFWIRFSKGTDEDGNTQGYKVALDFEDYNQDPLLLTGGNIDVYLGMDWEVLYVIMNERNPVRVSHTPLRGEVDLSLSWNSLSFTRSDAEYDWVTKKHHTQLREIETPMMKHLKTLVR